MSLKTIEKNLKVKFCDVDVNMQLQKISTGLNVLDQILEGGWPHGRLIEIFGEESTGKSTLIYTTMISLANNKKRILLIDEENSADPQYFKKLGLDTENSKYIKQLYAETGEQCLDAIIESIKTSEFDFIFLDSIAALTPKDEAIGAHARMFTLKLRKINKACSATGTTVIMTNQVRYNLKGLIAHLITTGGNALKHYASLRISLTPIDKTTKSILTKISVVKSKISTPFREGMMRIIFGEGIDKNYDIVEYFVQQGKIERKGNRYIINGQLVQFKSALKYVQEQLQNEEKTRKLSSK